ncbi:acyl-CoA dehydrogenase family protein [Rhodopila sp.]|jgi:alkylation response protein AidB-like acyl-CoA dehydrogenase|uniref:acyl-CoA dehydrogenase family protein n=1 Tax=Rhodopila sp. TaxID=2480087 RepID=UPI002C53DF58|nr:acyl-CoA dehydrogenase family protein [Rhodopila sp.]HVZ06721.1 acyl-CoA dehydrogenase family protein [Rhodopila sp.]
MNFDDTPEEAAFRIEARTWLKQNAPHHLQAALAASAAQTTSSVHLPHLPGFDALAECRAWQRRKYDGGWACLGWPREWGGRDATSIQRVIWQQEEGVYSHLNDAFTVSHGIAGPTILAHGTDAQKMRHLRRIAAGEELWCQLYSEPSGGSDLAGLLTRAVLDGDSALINGQKIWTTHAQIADYGLLLARTDPAVPKHQGLSIFLLDMRLPGITVQPVRQITGEASFNQVFLTDVCVPLNTMVGKPGDGWRVALTSLMNERLSLAAAIPTGVRELVAFCRCFPSAADPAVNDPAVRDRLATWFARASGLEHTMMRTISALSAGRQPGPENSIGKLVAGDMVQDIASFALDLQGMAGSVLLPDDAERRFQNLLLTAASVRIGGGTAEIQRNIIAERILGLPAEPRVYKP